MGSPPSPEKDASNQDPTKESATESLPIRKLSSGQNRRAPQSQQYLPQSHWERQQIMDSSTGLERYYRRGCIRLEYDERSPTYAHKLVGDSIRRWINSGSAEILHLEGPAHESDKCLSPMTNLAICTMELLPDFTFARRPLLSYFCDVPHALADEEAEVGDEEPREEEMEDEVKEHIEEAQSKEDKSEEEQDTEGQGRGEEQGEGVPVTGDSPAAAGLVGLVCSLIKQILELPVLSMRSDIDLSPARFAVLDGTMTTWAQILRLFSDVTMLVPMRTWCVIDGLQVLDDGEPGQVEALHDFVGLLQTDRFKALLTTSGQSAALRSALDDDETIFMGQPSVVFPGKSPQDAREAAGRKPRSVEEELEEAKAWARAKKK